MQYPGLIGKSISKTRPQLHCGFRISLLALASLQDRRQFAVRSPPWNHKATHPKEVPVQTPEKSPIPGFRRIVLPDTRKGKKAMQEATRFWEDRLKENGHDVRQLDAPLKIAIDYRPTAELNQILLDGIIFANNHPLGLKLYRIANPVPWSERSRTFKWLIYGPLIYYSGLLVFWFLNQEQEPITGRWRFNCVSQSNSRLLERSARLEYLKDWKTFEQCMMPSSHPRYQEIRSVLARLTAAAGLDHISWEVYLVNSPSMFGFIPHSYVQRYQKITYL